MREILVLCTGWEPDYWEKYRAVLYPKMSIESVKHLKDRVPIPAIGVYVRGKAGDYSQRPPCFLIVKSISENEEGAPHFDFHYVSQISGLTSAQFLNEMPARKGLFFSIPEEEVLSILRKFNIRPPREWWEVPEAKIVLPPWLDWVGARFQSIILKRVYSDEYEDRIAEIFRALGFEVEQLGHVKEGEYADGIAYSKDFAIIYDCKNMVDYSLNARDKRALINYVNRDKRRIQERRKIEKIYFAIIAHSFGRIEGMSDIEKETGCKGFLLTSEAMLYLLYKKLYLGPSFLLVDFEELISTRPLKIEQIENIYKG